MLTITNTVMEGNSAVISEEYLILRIYSSENYEQKYMTNLNNY
jgi:hypothetical protein